MFLEFYHLRQQPFGVTPDPAYLYLTRTHRDALEALLAGIKEGRGFFALIAEPGMGKTTLLYELLDELHNSARTVFLFQTQCDSREFFQYLLSELGVDTKGMDLVSMHNKLNEVLFAEMVAGRRFVLVVDEAQNLDDSVLETVRLLSNFETSYAKMLQIVLAGQPQLSDKLAQPQLAQLRQRLAVVAQLEPLSAAETANYVEHRLQVAGYAGPPLFTPEAVALVAQLSAGTPRTINHLCYGALTLGHSLASDAIGSDIVQSAAEKLGLTPRLPPAAHAPPEAKPSIQPAPSPRPVAQSVLRPIAAKADAPTPVRASGKDESAKDNPAGIPLSLTYQGGKRFRMPRWAFRSFMVGGLLLLAGISLTAFMVRHTEAQQKAENSQSPDQPATPETARVDSASANSRAVATSGPGGSKSDPNYSADPQEAGSLQVITVAAMPQQTLRDISLLYIGKFDDDLLKQIVTLNPELKDPNHPEAGQLIRLPLPPGSFRKGKVFTPKSKDKTNNWLSQSPEISRRRHMQSSRIVTFALISILAASALSAASEISAAIKKILDQRKDDFAAIRKDPRESSGETDYMSAVVIPGAQQCYIRQEVKPYYSDSCDVAESKDRAAVMAKYATYVRALKSVSPAGWIVWTEKKSKGAGDETSVGPDRSHPAASVGWVVEGMNADYYLLSVTVFADGFAHP